MVAVLSVRIMYCLQLVGKLSVPTIRRPGGDVRCNMGPPKKGNDLQFSKVGYKVLMTKNGEFKLNRCMFCIGCIL